MLCTKVLKNLQGILQIEQNLQKETRGCTHINVITFYLRKRRQYNSIDLLPTRT
jgi:hypothetical protein